MRTTYIQTGILVLALLISGFITTVNAQEHDRRFSISINGGLTLSGPNTDGINPALGLGLQYSLTPNFSIEGMGYYNQMQGGDQMLSASVRSVVHLRNILMLDTIWDRVAPNIFAGVGLIASNIGDFEGIRPLGVVGGSLSIRATNSLDILAQAELNIAHNLRNTATFTNTLKYYGIATLGVRYHFGSSDATPQSWRKPHRLTESDYNALMALGSRVDNVERRVASQGNQINTLDGRVGALESRVDGHEGRISDLERQYADLHAKVRDLEEQMAKRPATTDPHGLTQELPDGFYVQVYAAHTMSDAQRVARNVSGMVDSPVLITKRHNVYEVRIGVYERFPAAANTLRAVSGTYSDAFVVQFPRPAHLREDYRDIHRVD